MLRKKKSTSQKTEPVKESKSLLESLTERLNAIPPTITETRRIGTGFGVRKRTVEVPNPEYVALQNQIAALQTVSPEPPQKTPEPAQKTPEPSFMGPVAPDNLPTDIAPLSLSGIQGLLMPKVESPVEPPVEQPKIAVAPKLTQKTVTPQKAAPESPIKVVDPIRETTRPTEEFAPPTLASLSSQEETPSISEFVGPPGPANIPTDTAPLTLSGIEGLLKPTTPPVNVEELKQALAGVGDLSGGVSFAPPSIGDIPLNVGDVETKQDIEEMSRFSRAKLDPTGQKIYDQLKQQRESMEKAIGAEKASELYTSIGDLTQEETLAMMASELRDTGITDIYKVKQQDGIVQAPIQYGEIESAGEGAAREGYYYRDPRTNEIKEVDPSQVKDFQAAIPGRYTDNGEGVGEYAPGVAASGYVEVRVKQYVNTETGELLKQDISRSEYQTSDNILGDSSVAKRTYTGTGVQFTPDGVPIYFSTGFKQPSSWVRFRDQVRAIAPLAVAFIPGIGQAFTAAASSILGAGASQAAVTALSKGLASAVAGTIATGDLEKGILSGLTSGALGYGLGALQGLADVAYIPEVSASQLEAIGTGPLDYGVAAMEPSVAAEALTSLASDPNIAEELSNLSSTGALASIGTEVPVEFLQDIVSDIPTDSLEKLTDVVSDPNLVAIQDPEVLSDFLPDVADVIETGGPTDIPSSDILQEAGFDIPETPSLPDTSLEDILDQSALEDIGITETGLPSGEFDITDIVPKDSLPDITPPDLGITDVLPDTEFDITDVVPEGVTTDISDVPPMGEAFDITDIVPGEELADITDVVPPATEEIFDITDVVPGDVAATDVPDITEATDITETIPSGEALDVSDVLTEDILDITDVAPSEDISDVFDEGVTQAEDVIPDVSDAIPSEEAFDITDVVPKDNLADISPPEISSDVLPLGDSFDITDVIPKDSVSEIIDLVPGEDAFDITDVIPGGTETEVLPSIIQGQEPVDITDIIPSEDVADITDVVPSDIATEDILDITDVVPEDVELPIISDAAEVTDITDTIPSDKTFDITDAVSTEGLQDITDTMSAEDLADIVSEGAAQTEGVVPDISEALASEETFDITDVVPENTVPAISDVPPIDEAFDITDVIPGEELADITDAVPADLPTEEIFDITDVAPADVGSTDIPDLAEATDITDVAPPEDITDFLAEGSAQAEDVIPDVSDAISSEEAFDITDVIPEDTITDVTDAVPTDTVLQDVVTEPPALDAASDVSEDIFDVTDVVPENVEPIIDQGFDTLPPEDSFDITDVVSGDEVQDITDVLSDELNVPESAIGTEISEEPFDITDVATEEPIDITDVLPEEPISDVLDVPTDEIVSEPPVLEAPADEVFDITDTVPTETVTEALPSDLGIESDVFVPEDELTDITDVVPGSPELALDTSELSLEDYLNEIVGEPVLDTVETPFDITDAVPEETITDVTDVVPADTTLQDVVTEPTGFEAAPDVLDEGFDITDAVPTEDIPDITDTVSEGLTAAEDVTPSVTQDISGLPEEPFLDIEETVFEPETFEPTSPDYQDIDAILAEAEAPEFDITDIVPEETLTSPQFYDLSYDEVQQGLGSYTGFETPVEDLALSDTLDFVEPDIFDEDFGVELTQSVQNDPGFLPEEIYDVPPLPKSFAELANITDVLESTPGAAMTPDEFLQAVEESSVGDPYIASELAGSLPSDWDLPDLSYLNVGAAQEAAAAGSDTGNLPGNVMTPEQVADALKGGAGDPYVASEIAGVDPSSWDLPDPTDMQEFFKSPAGKLAYNRFTSFLLNKLKGDKDLSGAANLLNQAGQSGIAGLGATAPSALQFGYIPDFDITKAFSPTLYALRQRGQ